MMMMTNHRSNSSNSRSNGVNGDYCDVVGGSRSRQHGQHGRHGPHHGQNDGGRSFKLMESSSSATTTTSSTTTTTTTTSPLSLSRRSTTAAAAEKWRRKKRMTVSSSSSSFSSSLSLVMMLVVAIMSFLPILGGGGCDSSWFFRLVHGFQPQPQLRRGRPKTTLSLLSQGRQLQLHGQQLHHHRHSHLQLHSLLHLHHQQRYHHHQQARLTSSSSSLNLSLFPNINGDNDTEKEDDNDGVVMPSTSTSTTATSNSNTKTTKAEEVDAATASLSQNSSLNTILALRKLLKQQESEIDETKRLLSLLEDTASVATTTTTTMGSEETSTSSTTTSSSDFGYGFGINFGGGSKGSSKMNNRNKNLRDDPKLSSTAASILSGFDYGFISRSEGVKTQDLDRNLKAKLLKKKGKAAATNEGDDGNDNEGTSIIEYYDGPPENLWSLGSKQFIRNWNAIRGEYGDTDEEAYLSEIQVKYQDMLQHLTLNSTEIWRREDVWYDGEIDAPYIIKIPYLIVCYLLDVVFEGKYVPSRFYLLETVARMPYFSYITMLHLYETLGFWRRSAQVKRIHFAEELNEYRHLLIMESIGGDQSWWVRFIAQHSAMVYYVVLCILWAISPTLSYRFSELLETHAVNTYGTFLDENEVLLKKLPPSLAAIEYYSLSTLDPFYAEFQISSSSIKVTTRGSGKDDENGSESDDIASSETTTTPIRRPGVKMTSLYDVFKAIQEDELDHVKAMKSCLDPTTSIQSPSMERNLIVQLALLSAVAIFLDSSGSTQMISDFMTNTIGFDLGSGGGTGLTGSDITDLKDLADLANSAASSVTSDIPTDLVDGDVVTTAAAGTAESIGEGILGAAGLGGLLDQLQQVVTGGGAGAGGGAAEGAAAAASSSAAASEVAANTGDVAADIEATEETVNAIGAAVEGAGGAEFGGVIIIEAIKRGISTAAKVLTRFLPFL